MNPALPLPAQSEVCRAFVSPRCELLVHTNCPVWDPFINPHTPALCTGCEWRSEGDLRLLLMSGVQRTHSHVEQMSNMCYILFEILGPPPLRRPLLRWIWRNQGRGRHYVGPCQTDEFEAGVGLKLIFRPPPLRVALQRQFLFFRRMYFFFFYLRFQILFNK
jgi:hypothetical protein